MTHAISCFNCFNVLALPFSTARFSGESGCKDTTIPDTGKIFFRKNHPAERVHTAKQIVSTRKIFHKEGHGDKKQGEKNPETTAKGRKTGTFLTKTRFMRIINWNTECYTQIPKKIQGSFEHYKRKRFKLTGHNQNDAGILHSCMSSWILNQQRELFH